MGPVTLDVYVDACGSCRAAERVAAEAAQWFRRVTVRVHHAGRGDPLPDDVVAVPAFLIDGRLVQYGTPARDAMGAALIDRLLARAAAP